MMAEPHKAIEIGDAPEILRLAEEVQRAGEPRVLRKDGEDLAMVVPLPAASGSVARLRDEDLAATRAAAGSWQGLIDAEEFKAQIYAERGSDTLDEWEES
jgi:hypothetical protein